MKEIIINKYCNIYSIIKTLEKYVEDDGKYLLKFKNCKIYVENYKIHRDIDSAVEWDNGTKEWYYKGKLHRENKPAIVCEKYKKRKKEPGELIHGPQLIAYIKKAWYHHGKCHRIGAPAVEMSDGTKEWYINDLLHRVGGPAIEWSDGGKEWYQNGELHRISGPAIEKGNDTKAWYQNGELHRDNKPAIIYSDSDKRWYKNGKLHREDGPAIEWNNGDEEWCANGEYHRLDGPAVTLKGEYKEWYMNNKLHRLNGPAVKWDNDDEVWYYKGKLHRLNGPAVNFNLNSENYEEYCTDNKISINENKIHYFINGVEYTEERYYKIIKLIKRSEKKIRDKYARVWYEKCDKIGSKIYNNNMERGWKEIVKLYL